MTEKQLIKQRDAIATQLKERRLAVGLTQLQLADKCNLHRNTIAYMEKGITTINIKQLLLICDALELDITLSPFS